MEGKNILIAEDNPINRKNVVSYLNKIGLQNVHVAGNGEEAVQRCIVSNYHLILLDFYMPIMDGLQASRMIRQNSKGLNPFIVALTANVSEDSRLRAKESGMADFMGNPVDPLVLAGKVATYLLPSNKE